LFLWKSELFAEGELDILANASRDVISVLQNISAVEAHIAWGWMRKVWCGNVLRRPLLQWTAQCPFADSSPKKAFVACSL
jgi:hypothetical protein